MIANCPNNLLREDGPTICAPITAVGVAAISVVRLSGSCTRQIVERLCANGERIISKPRTLVNSQIFDLREEVPKALDNALVAFFAAPYSFTGEDCAEFHIHGSPFLTRSLLDNMIICGAQLAAPGEFSKRAYFNGKIDLAQAEAICDLIMAETEAQARVAKEQLDGRLSQTIQEVGEPLRDLLAEIEAFIDFPEEDIPEVDKTKWQQLISSVREKVALFVGSYKEGRIYRDGAQVVLVGRPNAGKSSLLNSLVGEERAIVTNIPGTTRDSIEERISIDGVLVRLWDTAGLSHGENVGRKPDVVEVLGIERSWQKIKEADLVLYLAALDENWAEQEPLWKQVQKGATRALLVFNKTDLLTADELKMRQNSQKEAVFVAARGHQGLAELRAAIYRLLFSQKAAVPVYLTTRRHFDALNCCLEALDRASAQLPPEILALEIRDALRHLDEIIGVTASEDILGRIFSKFCIGK